MMIAALLFLAANAAAQCNIKDAIVSNGVLIFENTDAATQFPLSMTTVPSGQTAYVFCDAKYLDSGSTDTYVANVCKNTAWESTLTCTKKKAKNGLRAKEARNICKNKWTTTMSQRCGWFDAATESITNGPCDAWDNRQCPFFKDRGKTSKNYNFCSCMPKTITN